MMEAHSGEQPQTEACIDLRAGDTITEGTSCRQRALDPVGECVYLTPDLSEFFYSYLLASTTSSNDLHRCTW
jgi:hypothetical protein